GKETREFVYELSFPEKSTDDKNFVEDLWARRKVGYLLDQIRLNGEKKELVEAVVNLAKRYGITTPYTSFLIVPDAPLPVARGGLPKEKGKPNVAFNLGDTPFAPPAALQNDPGKAPTPVLEFIKRTQSKAGEGYANRFHYAEREFDRVDMAKDAKGDVVLARLQEARARWNAYNQANYALRQGKKEDVQAGKLGVDLSCDNANLRCQDRLTNTATRWIGTRNCVEIGGVWIDEAYEAKMPTVTVKAMSDAYFKILERHP